MLKHTFLIATIALTAACVAPANQSHYNTAGNYTLDTSELDKPEVRASLKQQFEEAIKNAINKVNAPLEINNISQVKRSQVQFRGEQHWQIELHTNDGKVFQTRSKVGALSAEQLARLDKLKGAVVSGVLPIQNQPNHFYFTQLQEPRY